MTSPALLTDRYELTMVEAALRSGAADRRCVFEVFARSMPGGRRYGVVAGLGRLLEALPRFRFDDADIRYLARNGVVDEATRDFLTGYRFTGDIDGYPEGELYFPGSPVLTVSGSFAECVVLETVILSMLNHDSAVATAASRMVHAARGRPLIEMGSRRTHEEAAVASARAAHIAGFAATSNLAAGNRWGIPTTGTAAHAFTLVHDDERAAFTAQVAALGTETTLLVDTYDIREGIRTAIEVAGTSLGAIRLDSGDLGVEARHARSQLDELGATATRIVVTSDLTEYTIEELQSAPVDGYGVGTSLVTGSGQPTAAFVYKLVSRETSDGSWQSVAKRSVGKPSLGGRKTAARRLAHDVAVAEVVRIGHPVTHRADERLLQRPLVRVGALVDDSSLDDARRRLAASIAELPGEALELAEGEPAIELIIESVD